MHDTSQAIKDTENALRDLVQEFLLKRHGANWETHIGLTNNRITQWKNRREVERAKFRGAPIEERLLYYSDFYDLWNILKSHWDLFSPVFGKRIVIEVWLNELERLRDPNAHSRDLLPFQNNLALGISGDIRARIVRYRAKMESVDDYFPKIESVRDSVGHSWTLVGCTTTCPTIRVGDTLEFVFTATDPQGDLLEFGYYWHPGGPEFWSPSHSFGLTIDARLIGKMKELHLRIRSPRRPLAKGACDDFVMFHYNVLQAK